MCKNANPWPHKDVCLKVLIQPGVRQILKSKQKHYFHWVTMLCGVSKAHSVKGDLICFSGLKWDKKMSLFLSP